MRICSTIWNLKQQKTNQWWWCWWWRRKNQTANCCYPRNERDRHNMNANANTRTRTFGTGKNIMKNNYMYCTYEPWRKVQLGCIACLYAFYFFRAAKQNLFRDKNGCVRTNNLTYLLLFSVAFATFLISSFMKPKQQWNVQQQIGLDPWLFFSCSLAGA